MQNNNAPFKPIMQKQWNFVSIELLQIAGSAGAAGLHAYIGCTSTSMTLGVMVAGLHRNAPRCYTRGGTLTEHITDLWGPE